MKPWLIVLLSVSMSTVPFLATAQPAGLASVDAPAFDQSMSAVPSLTPPATPPATNVSLIPVTIAADPKWQGYFDALKDARSAEEARLIEASIVRMLARTGSSTVDLLLERADKLANARNLDAARALLDQSVALAPESAEPWRRRGEIAALQHDYVLAIDDLHYAISIEPSHFLALRSLGKLYADGKDKDAAIAAYRAALALDPWLTDVAADLARLEADVSN